MKIILTHWCRVTHICIGKLTIIGSDNGLAPARRQATIWTNAGILFIGPLGTNFSEILIAIETFSFKKMHLKISSAKWRPFCLGLNVLKLVSGHPSSLKIIKTETYTAFKFKFFGVSRSNQFSWHENIIIVYAASLVAMEMYWYGHCDALVLWNSLIDENIYMFGRNNHIDQRWCVYSLPIFSSLTF